MHTLVELLVELKKLAAEPDSPSKLERIKANEGTFSDLRKRIERDPDDLDSRWMLAKKLRTIGDVVGSEEQIAEIKERGRAAFAFERLLS